MLREVLIENLAIIKRMHVNFEDGLSIITGETGAGKSVVLHALGLLSGARAGKAMIRTGCKQAYVEGRFAVEDAKALHAFFRDHDPDEEIILSRTISLSGRSTYRVQGQLISLQEFKSIGELLLDVYGQKDRVLLEKENQLGLLDTFLDSDGKQHLSQFRKQLTDWREAKRFIAAHSTDRENREREMDVLRYQVEEIESFDVKGTDIDKLYTDHSKLLHAQDILEQVAITLGYFEGDGEQRTGLTDQFSNAWGAVQKLHQYDTEQDFSDRFSVLSEMLSEIKSDLERYATGIDADPETLELLDQRMTAWTAIQRKYGRDKEAVLHFYEEIQHKIAELSTIDERVTKAQKEEERLQREMTELASSISRQRKEIATNLSRAIEEKLASLRMPHVKFDIKVSPLEEFNDDGLDSVVFYIQPNKGLALRPLHEIASGGELSRVLLAIRALFSEGIHSHTVVFDEIDAGVSGVAAQAMAEQLSLLSRDMQIIAVSHLPQLASMGDRQYSIEKNTVGDETISQIRQLNDEERVAEISRLISGVEQTQNSLQQATDLLRYAKMWKENGGNYRVGL